jgi:CRISPR/Cas system-associated protein Csm6
MMRTVLSTCGTSLLTNGAEENLRKLITRKSNEKNRENILGDELGQIQQRIDKISGFLKNASQEKVCRNSAELNAIVKLYEERNRQWGNSEDLHCLTCTDTWLGEKTPELVESWLKSQGFSVEVRRQADLRTENINEFQLALSDLTK